MDLPFLPQMYSHSSQKDRCKLYHITAIFKTLKVFPVSSRTEPKFLMMAGENFDVLVPDHTPNLISYPVLTMFRRLSPSFCHDRAKTAYTSMVFYLLMSLPAILIFQIFEW